MAKFLILARPRKPMPEKANVEGARAQWRALRDAGKAEVYEIIEDNGAGVAVFLEDLREFNAFDEVWKEYFPTPPARTTIGTTGLLVKDAMIEIDLIGAIRS